MATNSKKVLTVSELLEQLNFLNERGYGDAKVWFAPDTPDGWSVPFIEGYWDKIENKDGSIDIILA